MSRTKKLRLRVYLGMLLAALIASLFFCTLYHYNNKYSQRTTQAINGLLILSEEDLSENPYRYLWNDWMYYPGVLLTPEDFSMGSPNRYMIYTDIDSSNRLSVSNRRKQARYGSGTYAMRIQLPDTEKSYAIDMPEVFSAYRMYINGRLVLSMGNPNPNAYRGATGKRLVTFVPDDDGTVDILIAVSNYTYFYSGITYPPAFGTPAALNYLRFFCQGLRLCGIMLLLVMALVCLYFFRKLHLTNAGWFALLCLCMIGWMIYPLLHILKILPIFPTYWLEILFFYLTLFLLVFLYNRICGIPKAIAACSNGFAGGFCIGISLFYLLSPKLPDIAIEWASVFIAGDKLLLSGYLLISSFLMVRRRTDLHLLLYGSTFFACACIWDRIFPKYDPIFGGWFLEWVCIFLVCSVGISVWHFLTEGYRHGLLLEQQYRVTEKQLAMQTNYTQQLNEQVEIRRRFVHDFRHHLRTIHAMAEQTEDKAILQYLDSIEAYITPSSAASPTHSSRPAVDALLAYYETLTRTRQITLTLRFALPDKIPLSDVELCTILGNLLENAVEACERLPKPEERIISVKTSVTPLLWCMTVENTFDGVLQEQEQKHFRTRKSDAAYHGIGLSSVEHTVKQHGGTLDIYHMEKTFRAGVTIPSTK